MSGTVALMRPDPLAFTGCAPQVMPAWSWTGVTQTPPEWLAEVLKMSAIGDPEDSNPAFRIRPMPDQDDRRTAVTTPAPPTDRDAPTNPEASREPILPPRAPLTLEDSYLDKAIRVVANAGARMAEDRAERQAQHAEVMAALREQSTAHDVALGKLAHELNTNLDMLSEAFKRHREASDARLAEGDERFNQIEHALAALDGWKAEILQQIEAKIPASIQEIVKPYLDKIEKLETELAALQANVPARTAPTSG